MEVRILSLHFQRSIFSGRIVTVIVTILHCMVTQQSRNTRTLVDYDGKHKLNVHSNKKKTRNQGRSVRTVQWC